LAWIFILAALGLAGYLFIPGLLSANLAEAQPGFSQTLWQDRGLDLLLQVVLIFAGTLGVIGLLADQPTHENKEELS
jgi:hypothetical protein